MKWIKRKPVKAGEIVRLTVMGVSGNYRAKVSAEDEMCLSVDDVEPVSAQEWGK